jgi:hypothetical protein
VLKQLSSVYESIAHIVMGALLKYHRRSYVFVSVRGSIIVIAGSSIYRFRNSLEVSCVPGAHGNPSTLCYEFLCVKVPFSDPIRQTIPGLKLSTIFFHSQIDYYEIDGALVLCEATSHMNQALAKDRALSADVIFRCSVDIDNIYT